jgi:hypothetical protein
MMLDSESPIDTPEFDAVQQAWFSADIAASTNATWRIVALHRPLYCTDGGSDCGVFASLLRDALEAQFIKAGIPLVLEAHMHGYERSYPVANGQVVSTNYSNPAAPTYVVNGAAGNREGNELPKGGVPWSAYQSAAYGYARIDITPAAMAFTFWESATNQLLDQFTITK